MDTLGSNSSEGRLFSTAGRPASPRGCFFFYRVPNFSVPQSNGVSPVFLCAAFVCSAFPSLTTFCCRLSVVPALVNNCPLLPAAGSVLRPTLPFAPNSTHAPLVPPPSPPRPAPSFSTLLLVLRPDKHNVFPYAGSTPRLAQEPVQCCHQTRCGCSTAPTARTDSCRSSVSLVRFLCDTRYDPQAGSVC